MFGFMLVSTHHRQVENVLAATEKHYNGAAQAREDVIRSLRSQLNTANDELGSMRAKLETADNALTTCRKHADSLTAKITADEPLVAAGKAAKRRETAKATVATTTVKKPAAKKAA